MSKVLFLILLLLGSLFAEDIDLIRLKDGYSKNSHTAYFKGAKIDKSDAQTFEVIGGKYSKDKRHVYYSFAGRDGTRYYTKKFIDIYIIEHADPVTFKRIDAVYSKDKMRVYMEKKFIYNADPSTFKPSKEDYSSDKNSAFYRRFPIENSHGKSFKYLDLEYAKDKYNVYFQGQNIHADVNSFKIVHKDVSDKENIYANGRKINKSKIAKPNARFQRDHMKQVVLDTKTDLMWQDNKTPYMMNWADAKTYCKSFGVARLKDWRLPNIKELYTLVDKTKKELSINDAFENTKNDHYWSTDTYPGEPTIAQDVYFGNGTIDWMYKNERLYIRCVRQ